jgi:hypothetical protein
MNKELKATQKKAFAEGYAEFLKMPVIPQSVLALANT